MKVFILNIATLLLVLPQLSVAQATNNPVILTVDLAKELGPMYPAWAWFGYDEPNYTYMKDGKKLLTEIAALSPGPVHVRVHNLLTTGDGTPALKWGSTNAYTEDKDGNPVYDWSIVDKIFYTFTERGMKPLVEIGFMPEALSTNPQPYKHKFPDLFNRLGISAKGLRQMGRIHLSMDFTFEVWKKMGSPQNPSHEQIAELEKAGQLKLFTSPEWIKLTTDKTIRKLELPRQGVSMLKFLW